MKKTISWMGGVCFIATLLLSRSVCAQNETFESNKKDWRLGEVIEHLQEKNGFNLSFSTSHLDLKKGIKLQNSNYTVEELLKQLEDQAKVQILRQGNKILIKPGKNHKPKATINGYIIDEASGEKLIGVAIRVLGDVNRTLGTITNVYGYYSLTIPKGSYVIEYTYVGYQSKRIDIELSKDQRLDLSLKEENQLLNEILVTASIDAPLNAISNLGVQRVNDTFFKSTPAMVGEPDIMKSIQTIPGINSVTEGSSSISVRGGGRDQNLILLDEAPVYNPSHLFGFYSVFNSDAIKDLKAYKGNFPAQYGGRTSSVIDIRMKEGNNQEFHGSGGIGLIASRLTLEGPIQKNKSSFLLSARRTYADIFLKLDPNDGGNNVNFYDLNSKMNFTFNENNNLFVSGYFGRDVLRFFDQYEANWGNATGTIRWNHVFGPKLFSNTSLIFSDYFYTISYFQQLSGKTEVDWQSGITDFNFKSDFTYYLNDKNTIRFGANALIHHFEPGKNLISSQNVVPESDALEAALYLSNDQLIGEKVEIQYGLRLSSFSNIGTYESFLFDENFVVRDSIRFRNDFQNSPLRIEPRLLTRYSTRRSQLELSYSRANQFIQTLSNSTLAFSAFDINVPASQNIKPIKSDLITLGWLGHLNKRLSISVETYFKEQQNVIDYRDHAKLIQNPYLEGELRSGEARSYGIELLLEKKLGRTTGMLSYTFSRSRQKIAGINNGSWYNAVYDRPHQVQLNLNHKKNEKWTFYANWGLASGMPMTFPNSIFQYGDHIAPIYNERNGDRLPLYHRLDLSAELTPKKNKKRKYQTSWVFAIYNAYYRINPISVNFDLETDDFGEPIEPNHIVAKKTYLLGIIPSFSYEFKF